MVRYSIRSKILLGVCSTIVLLLAVSGAGIGSILSLQKEMNQSIGFAFPTVSALAKVYTSLLKVLDSANTVHFLLSRRNSSGSYLSKELEQLEEAEDELKTSVTIYESIENESENKPSRFEALSEILLKITDFESQSRSFSQDSFSGFSHLDQRREDLERLIDSWFSDAIQRYTSLFSVQEKILRTELLVALRLQILAIVSCIAIALLFAIWLSGVITRPIKQLKESVKRLGDGDFSVRIGNSRQHDEIGELSKAFQQMIERLQESVISKDYLHSILQSLSEWVFVTDQQSYIKLVNKKPCEDLNVGKELFLGSSLYSFLNGSNGGDKKLSESFFRIPNQESIPVGFSTSPLLINGTTVGEVWILRDLREEKRAAEELRVFREKLLRSEQLASLGAMGGIVAHRLNQPLTSLRLFIQQALRGLSENPCPFYVKDNLEECLQEVESSSTIVKEILLYTRRASPERKDLVNFFDVAHSITRALYENCAQAGLQVNFEALESLPLYRGNRDECEEIFFILIENAYQAVDRGCSANLRITGTIDPDALTLFFKDTCRGILPSNINKVFDPFFTCKPLGEGTGLGLSILKQLVQNHQGEVSVESIPAVGTTFTIRLPVAKNE